MDEDHVGAAIRYVLLNPVRAGLARRAIDWPWSSVHSHLGTDDGVTDTGPVAARFPDLEALLASGEDAERTDCLRRAESIGRPIGGAPFIAELEHSSGRRLAPRLRGPKPRPQPKLQPEEISALSP